MGRQEDISYIRGYIKASDDGTWESQEALKEFVIDQLYDEFEDIIDLVEEAMEE